MACNLDKEKDIQILNELAQDFVDLAIAGEQNLDKAGINSVIKDIVYAGFKEGYSQDVALQFVQALPQQMIHVITRDTENNYLQKISDLETPVDFNYLVQLNSRFANMDAVAEFVSDKPKSKKTIEKEIKQSVEQRNNVVQDNVPVEMISSIMLNDKPRPAYADTSTGQIAYAENPDTLSEQNRNRKDPEKKMFYEVSKAIIWATRNNPNQEPVMEMPDGTQVGIKLLAQNIQDVDESLLTKDDKAFLKKNPEYNIITLFLSDQDGNLLLFDEQGNIDLENGRAVYQYARPVIKRGDSLFLGNRSGKLYTLVDSEDLAKQEIKKRLQNGEELRSSERKKIREDIKAKQTQTLNDVYRLNQALQETGEPTLVQITGGSYGITETRLVPLSQTDFVDGLNMIYIETVGNEGHTYFPVTRNTAGIAVDEKVYLQRIDMYAELANKMAKVLTTDAKLNNEELSPQQRLDYYNTFLSNRTSKNGIQVTIEEQEGLNKLQVRLKGQDGKYGKPLDLTNPETESIISDHLMSYVKGQYPANISYQNNFAVDGIITKDSTYLDYEFGKNKKGDTIIRAVTKNYFDFITSNAKVDYTVNKDNYFAGINSYFQFAVPEELSTPQEDLLELGYIGPVEEIDTTPTTDKAVTSPSARNFSTTRLSRKGMLTSNVNAADVVFAIGTDFETEDIKHIKEKTKENWEFLKVEGKQKNITNEFSDRLIEGINSYGNNLVINMVGNHMGDFAKQGWTQNDLNEFVYNVLRRINSKTSIQKIIVEGDTGLGEAAAKAAVRITDIPIEVVSPSDGMIRIPNRWTKTGYTTKKLNPREYVQRVFGQKWTNDFFKKKSTKRKVTEKKADPIIKDKKLAKENSKEETKSIIQKNTKNNIDDVLGASDEYTLIERNKKRRKFLDSVFTSKTAERKAEEWYKNSPLNEIVEFDKLVGIVNSDAYGLFYNSAWALQNDASLTEREKIKDKTKKGKVVVYDDALSIDMYHEAWHAFTQLVLTPEQRKTLYTEVQKLDKFKDAEFYDIEEELAEEYRAYARGRSTKLGRAVSKIFEVIQKILKALGIRSNQVTSNPIVNELFDKLYTGNFTVSAANSIQTLEPVVLERSKMIRPLKAKSKGVTEFTVEDSAKAVDILDTVMALTFQNYNQRFNTSSGALKILGNEQQKIMLYKSMLNKLELNKMNLETELAELRDSDSENLQRETQLQDRISLLDKIITNYGNVELSLDKQQKNGVVAFHLEKSRFTILREQYLQDIDDASSVPLFTTKEGNAISAKELSSQETMLFLTGIFKQELDSEGNGVRVRDEFGFPVLASSEIIWNQLAKVLSGSFDTMDIYNRLVREQNNYLEFSEILTMLPDPTVPYKNGVEFDTETNFWQDFKKPQIPYIQLTVNKTILEKRRREEGKIIPEKAAYESRVSRANFNLYKILNDWKTNFAVANTATNPYVDKDQATKLVNILNTKKLVADFSNQNGQLIPSKAIDFLKALGIEMDLSSYEIYKIVSDKEKLFAESAGVNFIFNVIKVVNNAANSNDAKLQAAAMNFRKSPMYYLLNGLPKAIEEFAGKPLSVKTRLTTLATLQNRFSDGLSNFSVLSPEKNKVWEHFVDNTITRMVTALNYAENWQQLTNEGATNTEQADPNGLFQHMRWLSTKVNPFSEHSVLLKAMFDLNKTDINGNINPNYGKRNPKFKLELKNIGGTQLNVVDSAISDGVSTAAADVTTKFLQEFHTMLESGVQEFMRHASKSTAMTLTFSGLQLENYAQGKNSSLYIDIQDFNPKNLQGVSNAGQNKGFNIVMNYLSAEARRIAIYQRDNLDIPGYNKPVKNKATGKESTAGATFTIFSDVLSNGTKDNERNVQAELYSLINEFQEELANGEFSLAELINEEYDDLRGQIKEDVLEYFTLQSQENLNTLNENRYVDPVLMEQASDADLSRGQIDKMLVDAYTWNSWIHNFETLILAYGDAVQYNHTKEEFHKRNAGLTSGGRSLRADMRAREYVNSDNFKKLYAEKEGYTVRDYDGTFNVGIMQEYVIPESKYYKEYFDNHVKSYTERFMKAGMNKTQATKKAKESASKILDAYKGMELADGQGYITFESYRLFKRLEGEWPTQQENLYKKIVEGAEISVEDVDIFFPPLKYQYFGNIKSETLPITSFHKFSLAPLIPTVIDGTPLADLHDKMMTQQIDYVTFQTGSKVSQASKADDIVNADGSIKEDATFTPNVVFAEYLKNQTAVPNKFKEVSIFSTQLRKLVIEGLYENGKIATTDEAEIKDALVKSYVDAVSDYTNLVTTKLLDDIGFEQDENGNAVAKSEDSVVKLAQLIRDNLTSEDVLSDQLIDIIDVTENGDLQFDLSFHPESNKIEKVLLSVINKTIIKQKVKGEALVQKSSAMYDNVFGETKFKKATEADIKKYVGSNFLPTYHKKGDGTTAAMKVMIALQGDYANLLNLEYEGEVIGTIDRLNEAIKDDAWLDANDGANRKAITMVGVRIPVQGLNSIEYMEIMHFLSPQAGNIIIPPPEIVAKSGADFDIDKLSIFMKSLDENGKSLSKAVNNTTELKEIIKDSDLTKSQKEDLYNLQKAGLENELIDIMGKILALPENYVSLTTPNSTVLLKDIADDLSQYVMEYNPKSNYMTESDGTVSPTRILESKYNLYKHESNVVGKQTLGLGAIENTFNSVFNYVGAKMPKSYSVQVKDDTYELDINMFLNHNEVDGAISLGGLYDANGENKISDVISQMINGWVDVEKDAWIFFIQGNYEVAPILLNLVKAGVPIKEAIYFVSQPLVREYVNEQRLYKSTFAEPLKRQAFSSPKYNAREFIIRNYFNTDFENNVDRYMYAQRETKKYLESKGRDAFTEEEMYKLIKDAASDDTVYGSTLSKLMFLHYLQIEDQMEGTKQLKLAANPDTTTMTDVNQAMLSQEKLDDLRYMSSLDQNLRNDLINNSVISSFFNNNLIKSLGQELFSFRYDSSFDIINEFLNDRSYKSIFTESFGSEYKTLVPQQFRNDFINFLYQNAKRKYYLGDTFNSKTLSKNVPVQQVASLRSGAAVKDGILYVDENQIRTDFANKVWLKSSKSKNSYTKKGLYPLEVSHFTGNAPSNYQEYLRFVLERESIRADVSKKDFFDSELFKERYAEEKKISILSEDKLKNYLYEQYIANKALTASSNVYHMFSDPQFAYAVEFKNIVDKYDLKNKYDVLKRLEVDVNADRSMFNIYLNDKDLDNFRSNLYTKNLADLANRTVMKVDDIETNNYISDFFSNMTTYAAFQSGITKSKYNLLSITDFNTFINTLNPLVGNYLNSDTVTQVELLMQYFETFLINNLKSNRNRLRFKNYLNESSMDKTSFATEDTSQYEAFKFLPYKVTPTSNPGVTIYNNVSNTAQTMQNLVKANPEVVFLYPASYLQLEGDAPKTNEALLDTIGIGNALPIMTGINEVNDNLADVSEEDMEDIKDVMTEQWEKTFKLAEKLIDQGRTIALPFEGIGNLTIMPQDLFISLSKTLLTKFGYVNPGSETSGTVFENLDQEINDAEILEMYNKENPLNC